MAAEERLWEEIEQSRTANFETRRLTDEVAAVVWGDSVTRNNGLRSRVTSLEKRVQEGEKLVEDLWNVKRPLDCIGLKALEVFKEEQKKAKENDVTIIKERISSKGVIIAAAFMAVPGLFSALISLLTLLKLGTQMGAKP